MSKKREEIEARIEEKKHEREQLEHQYNRYKNMECYLRDKERRARAHRLIQRGGAVESILPEVKELDDETFYLSMELFFGKEENRLKFKGCIFSVQSGELR